MTKRRQSEDDEDLKGAKLIKFLARSARDKNWQLSELAQRNPNHPELYYRRLLQGAVLGLLAEEIEVTAGASIKRGEEFARSGAGAAARRRQGRADEIKTIYRSFMHHPSHMRAALTASRLGLSVPYVRKVIARKKSELG